MTLTAEKLRKQDKEIDAAIQQYEAAIAVLEASGEQISDERFSRYWMLVKQLIEQSMPSFIPAHDQLESQIRHRAEG